METSSKRGNIEDNDGCASGGIGEEEAQGMLLGVENGTSCIATACGRLRRKSIVLLLAVFSCHNHG